MPVRSAGFWTESKLWFWNRYIEITTTAMVGSPHWNGLYYVDLFAGPGVCQIEGSGKRIPGSSLIAANSPKPFTMILSSELDVSLATALQQRLSNTPARDRFKVFAKDCNSAVHEMVRLIPARALTLAFIDPEALHVRFETIQTLASIGRTDLLILFADRMDIVRNVELYEKQQNSNLDLMLGPNCNWREPWSKLLNRTGANICRLFANLYKDQLRTRLGYVTFGERVLPEQGPIYRLIYASKHKKGLEFWDKITKRDQRGQMDLGFGA
jgi:three-Cys-motif partner protein